MKKLLSFLLIGILGAPALVKAQELDDVHLRPSYTALYQECHSNPEKFKRKAYTSAFQSGLYEFLEVTSLSPKAISASVNHWGISTYVYNLLSNEATFTALNDCFPDATERRIFLDLMHLSDGSGKAAGLLVIALGGKLVTSLSKEIYTQLAKISPELAERAFFIVTIAASSYSLYNFKKQMAQNKPTTGKKDPTLEKDEDKKMTDKADYNIQILQADLAKPNLPDFERQRYQAELQQWQVVRDAFK